MPLTLLLGGARSGKTSLAVEMATRRRCPVAYVATAPTIADDIDLAERVARHRSERPAEWTTIEEEIDLIGAVAGAGAEFVVIDCITLWVSNLLHAGQSDASIRDTARRTADAVAGLDTPIVAVSNEVGLGVHPASEVGRRYRDLLGWVNQAWARSADTTLLLVAGRALRLDDPWAHLGFEHNDDRISTGT